MKDDNDLITWSNKLACGIKLIDDQHKGLVDLINEMFNHVTGNQVQERDYFERVIKEATSYVKNHLATEERIMLTTKFPGYAEHKKEHEAFIHTIVGNIVDYRAGKRFTLSTFTRFLRDWVLSHIALIDKQYFEHFKSLATRQADGRLVLNLKELHKNS